MDNNLVTLATYLYIMPAETAKWALEEQGIPAYLGDANTVVMDWLLGNAIGGIKLNVAESDVPRAMEFLMANPRLLQNPAPESTIDDATCLNCGAALAEGSSECSACGWSFLDGAEVESE